MQTNALHYYYFTVAFYTSSFLASVSRGSKASAPVFVVLKARIEIERKTQPYTEKKHPFGRMLYLF